MPIVLAVYAEHLPWNKENLQWRINILEQSLINSHEMHRNRAPHNFSHIYTLKWNWINFTENLYTNTIEIRIKAAHPHTSILNRMTNLTPTEDTNALHSNC